MRFRYQLEGLDTDWIEVGDRRSVQYPWLRPGEYIFRVSACNNDGLWSPDGAAIALRVRPQFHETWWFPTLLAVAAIAAAAGLVRQAATRRFRQQLAVLERQRAVELDRARIAKDIHDDLGAGLTQITLLSELARRDPPEEAHTHLEHISGTARELTRAMDEIVWAVNPQNDTLDGLVTYVCKFAPEYLRVGGIPCRLDLPAELPTRLLPAEVRHHLFLAIKEALNNIVKHAHASEVWLRLALARDGFTFVIEDNGRGLPLVGAAAVPDNGGRVEGGHGLSNLENRLAAIGGRCQVRSVPGQGTRVEFFVPHDLPAAPAPSAIAPESERRSPARHEPNRL
jgi:signal transduction histidine kinase